jgi:Tfp pilus assembly protein PilV
MRSRNSSKQLTSEQGYILADAAMAIVIISIALLAISALFTQAIVVDMVANHYTIAGNLAQQQLELLKSQPTAYWSTLAVPCTIAWQDATQLPPPEYTVTTSAAISTANDQLVAVTVNVCWVERSANRSLEFVTLYPLL